jgi:hypothetical protein
MKYHERISFIFFYSVYLAVGVFVFGWLFYRRGVGYALGLAAFAFSISLATNVGIRLARRRNERRTKRE